MSLTKATYSMIKGAPFNVLDYASLATTVTAKDQGDPASHLFTSFLSWKLPIQAALDAANDAGGGSVVLPKNTVPYYLDDFIYIHANTTLVCEDWLVLADYTTVGHTVQAYGDNILVQNLLLDNSNIYAGGSGQNGVTAGQGKNIKFYAGEVKNCKSGNNNDGTGDGGKGIQLEPGGGEDIVIDGLTLTDCFIGMSTIREFLESADPYYGIIFDNITASNCLILFIVKQVNAAQSKTGLQHSVKLNNFYAVNCGAFEGVMQFSRASNVQVSNGIVVCADGISPTSLIRGNHANCTFINIGWYGNTSTCINLDKSTYAQDESQPNENNRYDINVWGQVNYFAEANSTGAYPTLNSCVGNVSFRFPPAVAFFGNALRNGTSTFDMSCNTGPFGNSKIIQTQTSLNFYGSNQPATFEGFDVGTFNQVSYAASIPTTGTHFVGKVVYNNAAAPSGFVGWVCTTAGTFGTYSEGRTVTATGTAIVTLSSATTVLQVGMYLTINGVASGKILSITGTTMVMSSTVAAGSGLSIAYSTPVYKTFGAISA